MMGNATHAFVLAASVMAAAATTPVAHAQWSETQKLLASDGAANDLMGLSVAIDGDVAVVGAIGDEGFTGAAYVYRLDGTTWVEEQKLTASGGIPGEEFGNSVAVGADVIVVGAHFRLSGQGVAFVYRYDGATWIEEQTLIASDGGANERFGESVSIDGDTVVVGANLAEAAYVYRHEGSSWVEERKLTAGDGAAGQIFGTSVSISGPLIVVGSPWDDDAGNRSGSAYVFRYDGATWVEEQKLTASDAAPEDWYGLSVAVEGDTAIVGSPEDDDDGSRSGAAYRYRYDGASWVEAQKLTASDAQVEAYFGASVSLRGAVALVGASGSDAAYVYRDAGAGWSEEQKITASDGEVFDLFGSSVALDGVVAIIGAREDDDNGSNAGAAYMQVFSDFTFGDPQEVAQLNEPTALGPSNFEAAAIVGAETADIWVTTTGPVEGEPGSLVVLLNDGSGLAFEEVATMVGVEPRNAAIADFDGANGPDAAVANAGDDTVSILLNDGTGQGRFSSVVTIPVGTRPSATGVGDLVGDDAPDVVVTLEGDDTVSILQNDGAGAFVLVQTIAVGAAPSDVIVKDYDGDGLADLLVTNSADNDVTFLRNDGLGGFERQDTSVGSRPGEVDPEDLDNDKDFDAVVRNADSGTLSLLINDGSGTFQEISLPVGNGPTSVASGDLDLDGDPELLVVSDADLGTNRVIRVFRNELQETGKLRFIEVSQLITDPARTFVEVASLDGDRYPDIIEIDVQGAGGEGSGRVNVLLNEPPCPSDVNGSGSVDFADLLALLAAWGPCPACPEDLNGDGFVAFADLLLVLGSWGPCS